MHSKRPTFGKNCTDMQRAIKNKESNIKFLHVFTRVLARDLSIFLTSTHMLMYVVKIKTSSHEGTYKSFYTKQNGSGLK